MGQLAPRDFSFSDIYALNRKPNAAGFCLPSPHGIISSFQELCSVSESASLSLVSFKFPMTLEEMPRIAPASQPSRAWETAAQKPAFMESCGELIQKPPNSVSCTKELSTQRCSQPLFQSSWWGVGTVNRLVFHCTGCAVARFAVCTRSYHGIFPPYQGQGN